MSFIANTVAFLAGRASTYFDVSYPTGSTFGLRGHPVGLMVDQGHTSNGAAGTALILIGFGGLLVIWLERRRARKVSRNNITYDRVAADINGPKTGDSRPSGLFTFWIVLTILSTLLTLAALIYVFVLGSQTDNQTIDLQIASQNSQPSKYPLDDWTPDNWFGAILNQVPLTYDSDRHKINQQLRIMRGWKWNLIPLFVLGLITTCTAVWEWLQLRRSRSASGAHTKQEAF